jgi:RNA polymerase sigma factor (sigma-70 family)
VRAADNKGTLAHSAPDPVEDAVPRDVPRKPSRAPRIDRSDAECMRCVAEGDVGALGEVYDRHAASLLNFARRVAPTGEAEDVVQATFLRALKLAPQFDAAASSARAWLFAIAARLVQGRRRSLTRLGNALRSFALLPRAGHTARDEATGDVERALQSLPHDKRVVFVLSQMEGFSAEQVAAMLQIPVGTVWTRLHHARKGLRAFFAEVSP